MVRVVFVKKTAVLLVLLLGALIFSLIYIDPESDEFVGTQGTAYLRYVDSEAVNGRIVEGSIVLVGSELYKVIQIRKAINGNIYILHRKRRITDFKKVSDISFSGVSETLSNIHILDGGKVIKDSKELTAYFIMLQALENNSTE